MCIRDRLDRSLPVFGEVTYEKLEEELIQPKTQKGTRAEAGNWNQKLKVYVPVTDNLSGVKGLQAVQAVSYTHLDVYKRQAGIRASFGAGTAVCHGRDRHIQSRVDTLRYQCGLSV